MGKVSSKTPIIQGTQPKIPSTNATLNNYLYHVLSHNSSSTENSLHTFSTFSVHLFPLSIEVVIPYRATSPISLISTAICALLAASAIKQKSSSLPVAYGTWPYCWPCACCDGAKGCCDCGSLVGPCVCVCGIEVEERWRWVEK